MTSYAHHHSSPVKGETMEALKGSCQTDEGAEDVAATSGPALWGLAERDDFSVEDLLDLEEFGEADKDEHLEAPPVVKEDRKSSEKDGSQQSSIVSFELVTPLPPPPEIVDLPAHDVEELEWVSCIMDDSLAEPPPLPQPPASVTASLGSRPPLPRSQDGVYRPLTLASNPLRRPAICVVSTEALVPVKAKRSKRARASGWSLSCVAPFFDSSSSSTATSSLCSSSASFSPFFRMDSPNLAASNLLEDYHTMPPPNKKYKHCKNSKPKKRGRKPKNSPTHPSGAAAGAQGPGDRHCGHCGIQKTPQWREGPEGAKTLCNACGVRYKSGRLFPEYRPASSPTFMSAVHSNSHRKVLEMRLKKVGGPLAPTAPALA